MADSRFVSSIRQLLPSAWNRLLGCDQAPLRHEFLEALESGRNLHNPTSWNPRYLIRENPNGSLLGAIPMFEKTNSRGEFIFDWAWADALEATGRAYYPKLVVGVPFTPVPGARLLLAPEAPPSVGEDLIRDSIRFAQQGDYSSLHWLFHRPEDVAKLEATGHLLRQGCHFLWTNAGYVDFEQWLSTLTASRRKKIRRERRKVHEAGVECLWLSGQDLDESRLQVIYDLYASNYHAHGMVPYLAPEFFRQLSQSLPDALRVCLAHRNGQPIACAIFLQDQHQLYGRYWGSFESIDSLHFEVCYYQGIEQAIAHRLEAFHPGVQGEHKLIRGFSPVLHYSSHWFRDADLKSAVEKFLLSERNAIENYREAAEEVLPVRRPEP